MIQLPLSQAKFDEIAEDFDLSSKFLELKKPSDFSRSNLDMIDINYLQSMTNQKNVEYKFTSPELNARHNDACIKIQSYANQLPEAYRKDFDDFFKNPDTKKTSDNPNALSSMKFFAKPETRPSKDDHSPTEKNRFTSEKDDKPKNRFSK